MKSMDNILKRIETDYKGQAYCDMNGKCMYLTYDGRKCAIGLFVSGKKFQSFKGPVDKLIRVHGTNCIELLPTKNINKLINFQRVHDIGISLNDLSIDEQKMMLQFSALNLFEDEL